MPRVYKYCPPERIDILQSGMIMLSKPRVFNDPFELKPHCKTLQELVLPIPANATPQMKVRIDEMQARINNQVMPPSTIDTILENKTQTIVILSLSEVPNSLLMWAHYAAAHTGFVIGFSSPDEILAIDSPHRHIAKVNYAVERPGEVTFEEITNDELLLTKSIEWKYEQEWRILDSLYSADGDAPKSAPDSWPFKFRRESITQVIVGCRASDGFVKEIEHVLDSNEAYKQVQQGRYFRDLRDYKLRLGHITEKE